ncbi:MAG: hypothetical protein WBP59_07660, partial [Ilumatobacteraceae bacterium]
VLARVITSLGSLDEVGVDEVEGLFAADLACLPDLYGIINFGDQADVEALQASVLPEESYDEVASAPVGDDAPMVDDDAAGTDDSPAPRRRRGSVEEVASTTSS